MRQKCEGEGESFTPLRASIHQLKRNRPVGMESVKAHVQFGKWIDYLSGERIREKKGCFTSKPRY